MTATNVFEFAPALQRRREQKEQTARAGHQGTWRSRYRDGIDGLWARKPTSAVVQLVIPRNRPTTVRIDETNNG